MFPSPRSVFGVAVALLFAFAQQVSADDDLTVEDLLRLAPVIDSADPAFKSFEIDGRVLLPSGGEPRSYLKIRAVYRAPEQFALTVYDATNDAVILFAADEKAFVYDAVRKVVVYLASAKMSLSFYDVDDTLRFEYGVSGSAEKEASFKLDVRSLISGRYDNRELKKGENGRYHYTLTTLRGNFIRANVDPSRECPITQLGLYSPRGADPLFSIDNIFVNTNTNDSEFFFPEKGELQRLVKVDDLSSDSSPAEKVNVLARALLARLAILRPDERARFGEVDWARVVKEDREFTAALSRLLAR